MALAIDGAVSGTADPPATSVTTGTLTTSNPNDVIIVIMRNSATAPEAPSNWNAPTATGLTFNKRYSSYDSNSGGISVGGSTVLYIELEIWYAVATSVFTGTISASLTGASTGSTLDIIAFGVSGANTSSPFDPSSTFVASSTTSSAQPQITGVSTTNPNTLLFAFTSSSNNAGGTGHPASGYTTIVTPPSGRDDNEYKVFSSSQSSITVSFTTSDEVSGYGFVILVDAIQAPVLEAPQRTLTGVGV